MSQQQAAYIAAGARCVITKPWTWPSLKSAIWDVLQNPHSDAGSGSRSRSTSTGEQRSRSGSVSIGTPSAPSITESRSPGGTLGTRSVAGGSVGSLHSRSNRHRQQMQQGGGASATAAMMPSNSGYSTPGAAASTGEASDAPPSSASAGGGGGGGGGGGEGMSMMSMSTEGGSLALMTRDNLHSPSQRSLSHRRSKSSDKRHSSSASMRSGSSAGGGSDCSRRSRGKQGHVITSSDKKSRMHIARPWPSRIATGSQTRSASTSQHSDSTGGRRGPSTGSASVAGSRKSVATGTSVGSEHSGGQHTPRPAWSWMH